MTDAYKKSLVEIITLIGYQIEYSGEKYDRDMLRTIQEKLKTIISNLDESPHTGFCNVPLNRELKEKLEDALLQIGHMSEGLQSHREELAKSRALYEVLKDDFEDLAKEDNAIRAKAIKDLEERDKRIKGLKELIELHKEEKRELRDELKIHKTAQKGHDIITFEYPVLKDTIARIETILNRPYIPAYDNLRAEITEIFEKLNK